MNVKFFADNINDRRTWSWVDGEYTTSNMAEIDDLKSVGFRFEEQESVKVKRIKAEEKVVHLKAKEKKSKKKVS
jgi:hypothetical protein